MADALEDRERTVSIGGRTITNLRFVDGIDGLAGEKKNWQNYCLRRGDQCRKDQGDDKQPQRHQRRDQSKWTEA